MGDKKPVYTKSLKDDLSLIWDVLKSLTFFLGLYLFFLGWLYLYYYFQQFDVAASSVTVSLPSFYNFGFIALIYKNMLVVFSIFFSIFFFVYYNRGRIKYAYILLFAGIFLFFILSFYLTRDNAKETAMRILKKEANLNPVYFDFTADFLKSMTKDSAELKLLNTPNSVLARRLIKNQSVKLLKYNDETQLYLIYENNESFFVINNQNPKGKLGLSIEIFSINKKDINYATKILSHNNN